MRKREVKKLVVALRGGGRREREIDRWMDRESKGCREGVREEGAGGREEEGQRKEEAGGRRDEERRGRDEEGRGREYMFAPAHTVEEGKQAQRGGDYIIHVVIKYVPLLLLLLRPIFDTRCLRPDSFFAQDPHTVFNLPSVSKPVLGLRPACSRHGCLFNDEEEEQAASQCSVTSPTSSFGRLKPGHSKMCAAKNV